MYEPRCEACSKMIKGHEPYFSGHWVPEERSGESDRRFGCAPIQNFCHGCMKEIPNILLF